MACFSQIKITIRIFNSRIIEHFINKNVAAKKYTIFIYLP